MSNPGGHSQLRSLYRRSLQAAALSIEQHRAWSTAYVRNTFREAGSSRSLERRLDEGEEELARFLLRLRQAGRPEEPILRLGQRSAGSRRRSAWSHDPFRREQRSSRSAAAAEAVPPVATSRRPVQAEARSSSSEYDDVHAWSLSDVQAWLRNSGLAEHAEAFALHRVDGALLVQIDDEDLRGELGITSRLQRKRLLAAVRALIENR